MEFYEQEGSAEEYRRLILGRLARLEPIDISCIVTGRYVLDFAILHESLVESWTFFPFRLHAFVVQENVHERLVAANFEHAEIHLVDADAADWAKASALSVKLVEESGLERSIVTDADNVFLAETPELSMLLNEFDFVFISSPQEKWFLQASLWAFRSNPRSREFARLWHKYSLVGKHAEASGLPYALLENTDEELKIAVLAKPRPESHDFQEAPYDIQANLRPFHLTSDALGFRERQMGRAKVLHLAGLRARGTKSAPARLDAVIKRFPELSPFLPLYAKLTNAAAARLGLDPLPDEHAYVRQRLYVGGVLPRRAELPLFLNTRGLVGRGAEVGVREGRFSENILARWQGTELISIDPWRELEADEYVDVSNVSQARHDELYAETRRRLAPFGDRSSIWRMPSEEAAARVNPGSLDFVYLDAMHDYESVKRDLELWCDKIRPGGIFAGHDYLDGELRQGVFGVKSAVDEFFSARSLPVRVTHGDAPWSSWLVEIPDTAGEQGEDHN